MDKKIRLILLGLIVLFLASIVYSFSILSSKEALRKEYLSTKDSLTKENEELARRANAAMEEKRSIERRIGELQSQIDKLSQDNRDLQSKQSSLLKEKNELVEKLKAKPTVVTQTITVPAESPRPEAGEAYWAGIIKQKTDLEMQLAAVQGKIRTSQLAAEQLQREKGMLELDITNLRRENQDLRRQFDFRQKELQVKLEQNQKLMDSIAEELVREKNDKFKIQEMLNPLKEENMLLRRQIKMINARKSHLENKLADLEASNNILQKKLGEMDVMIKEKNLEFSTLQKGVDERALAAAKGETLPPSPDAVELPEIVVRPTQGTSVPAVAAPQGASAVLSGKVLAVNRENNFIVVDIGEEAGIRVGDTFRVYKGATPVANVQVIQTRKAISACDIVKEASPIKVGDTVR